MHSIHSGFTVSVNVNNNEVEKLINFLRKLQKDNLLDLEHSQSTLYASIVILPSVKYGQEDLPATLMFFSSFSGPFQKHLEELITYCGVLLSELFKHCNNFPEGGKDSKQELRKFMLKHRHTSTFYSGLHGITAADIYREEMLKSEIVQFINISQQQNQFIGMSALQIRKLIQTQIKGKGNQYDWAHKPHSKKSLDFWVLYWKAFAFVAILLLIISSSFYVLGFWKSIFLFSGFILFLAGVILFIESGKHEVANRLSDERLRTILASQNNPIVNEMTVAGPVKKGFLRRLVFISLLKIVSYFHGTIRIPTVCTARWVALNSGKRLIFISNFTNQSDFYVRDFIDSPSSARGINLLFGHGEGYPKTKWLGGGGNKDNPEGFMNVLHQNQHVTQYWYAPFKNLTVDMIINNRKIRDGLFVEANAIEAQNWLNLL